MRDPRAMLFSARESCGCWDIKAVVTLLISFVVDPTGVDTLRYTKIRSYPDFVESQVVAYLRV